MYNTGNDRFLAAICDPSREIDTYVELQNAGEPLRLDTYDIVSYQVTSSSMAGKVFVPGSFVAGQLKITLNTNSDRVKEVDFKTLGLQRIDLSAGISVRARMVYVPVGQFYPEEDGIKIGDDTKVEIEALDIPPILYTSFFSDTLLLPCTIAEALNQISVMTGLTISISEADFPNLSTVLTETFSVTTSYREVLQYIAELLGAYIHMGRNGEICLERVFKGLVDIGCTLDENYLFSVSKQEGLVKPFQYIGIKANKDDLGVAVQVSGVTTGCRYDIINNPLSYGHPEDFLAGLVLPTYFTEFYPSKLSFQGRPDLDIGDVLEYTHKGTTYTLPICTHVFEYNGGFKTTVESVGSENLNASSTDAGTKTQITALQQNINSVEKTLESTQSKVVQINGDLVAMSEVLQTMEVLKTQVSALSESVKSLTTLTQDMNQLRIDVRKELDNGATKVVTNTGFVFDDKGMSVEKSGSEMSTQITEDGMKVFRDETEVLAASHTGVKATNLHADTYLLIGDNSRLEDYGEGRTGLFWIGGSN